jgi:hypothetical protein
MQHLCRPRLTKYFQLLTGVLHATSDLSAGAEAYTHNSSVVRAQKPLLEARARTLQAHFSSRPQEPSS